MKSILFAAASLACMSPTPVMAQALTEDRFEGHDWWVVQPGGERAAIVLSNGLPDRFQEKAILWLVILYSKPGLQGQTGVALSLIIDCKTRTASAMEPFMVDANGELKHKMSVVIPWDPLAVQSPLYRFGCEEDRSSFRHMPGSDRKTVSAELRADWKR